MQSVIRIGSRESRLAVKQAEIIKDQIRRCDQTILVEIITMKTTGDKILDRSLESVGGKGLFVKELDQALADGRIDLAVHSLKDMPMRCRKSIFFNDENIRDMIFKGYVITYRIKQDRLEVFGFTKYQENPVD